MESKPCLKCEQEKPLSDYHNHAGRKDGKSTTCKDCAKKKSRKGMMLPIAFNVLVKHVPAPNLSVHWMGDSRRIGHLVFEKFVSIGRGFLL